MLEILALNVNVVYISKVLGRNNLKAYVTKSRIIIDSDSISDEVSSVLAENADIIDVRNFYEDEFQESQNNIEDSKMAEVSVQNELSVETVVNSIDSDNFIDVVEEEPIESLKQSESFDSKVVSDLGGTIIDEVSNESFPEAVIFDESKNEDVNDENQSMEQFGFEKNDGNYQSQNCGIESVFDDVEIEETEKSLWLPPSKHVHYGEVYQLGKVKKRKGIEGLVRECVIIIQKDFNLSTSDETIALFCTSYYDQESPINFKFCMIKKTMSDFISEWNLGPFYNCSMYVSHIIGVNLKKLGRYLGTMNNYFMDQLQPMVDFCLGRRRERYVNIEQINILSTVNILDLLKIPKMNLSDDEKVDELLKLFNFDMSKNGIQYLKQCILVAYRYKDYCLDNLAKVVAKDMNVEKDEVIKLVAVRVKEHFNVSKSVAISFIRLIDSVMKKG